MKIVGKFAGTIFPILADILGVVGFCLAVYVSCHILPREHEVEIDYQAILIAILAAIFTLVVGWNIYQAVDWKEKIKKNDEENQKLQNKLKEELNYLHNSKDFNQAITYAMMSQTASAHFAPNEEQLIKYQMLLKGWQSMKILSNFPDCHMEIKALVDTLIKGLNNSENVLMTSNQRRDLLEMYGEITNKDQIDRFNELFDLIDKLKINTEKKYA